MSQTFAISLPVTNVNEAPSISVYLAAGEFTTIGDNSSGPLYELSFDDPDEQDLPLSTAGSWTVFGADASYFTLETSAFGRGFLRWKETPTLDDLGGSGQRVFTIGVSATDGDESLNLIVFGDGVSIYATEQDYSHFPGGGITSLTFTLNGADGPRVTVEAPSECYHYQFDGQAIQDFDSFYASLVFA
ncbi:hypothetical protein OAI46_02975 [Alphaproteobacteria bacterium]|nr:hypothetical protein [Alphaproteobacteria bacterium]